MDGTVFFAAHLFLSNGTGLSQWHVSLQRSKNSFDCKLFDQPYYKTRTKICEAKMLSLWSKNTTSLTACHVCHSDPKMSRDWQASRNVHLIQKCHVTDRLTNMSLWSKNVTSLTGCQECPSDPKTSRHWRGAPKDLLDVYVVKFEKQQRKGVEILYILWSS